MGFTWVGYPTMLPLQGDYFDRVRLVAALAIAAAGIMAVVGSLLDWVAIEVPAELVPGFDFGDQAVDEPEFSPFSGVDSPDGIIVLFAGIALVGSAVRLLIRRRGAWLAFLVSVVVGGIGVADYRSANDLNSGLCQRMQCLGDIRPGVGLTLVAVAGVLGLIASVAAVAATPRVDVEAE